MKKVVLFSSNTKKRKASHFLDMYPKWNRQWDEVAAKHEELDITLVFQLNGRYLLDIVDGKIADPPRRVKVVTLPADASIADFIKAIEDCKPDIVLAMPLPISGYDWNVIRDAAIADSLRDDGIECICSSFRTALDCFDKGRTNRVLKDNGFNVSEGFCVDHELFRIDEEKTDSTVNAYRESVLWKIRKMAPVIIKSATGSGSIGIHVSENFEDAKQFLLSEDFSEDMVVERFIKGDEYGVEIHGCNGKYIISPPFRKMSFEQRLVNDPLGMATLKYGPVCGEKLHVDRLRNELERLADVMGFTGIVNLDLFFADDKWYIIDINSRWSGITSLVTAAQGRSAYDVFVEQITGTGRELSELSSWKRCLQFKIPQSDPVDFGALVEEGYLTSVSHEKIIIAGEERWYNDAVTKGYDSLEDLAEGFASLREKYPQIIPEKSVKTLKEDIDHVKSFS
ncbi:MAG: ATP-grasp domain-containing protein [Lachnospiraceae bacterium]|nr:ATP-grasp domain-containing protein [Lachnospiraceae bacterium]